MLKQVQELEAANLELQIRRALKDKYYWLTELTATVDEQDPGNPNKPFPKKCYIRHLLAWLNDPQWTVGHLKKARTMMCSWTCSAWAAHEMFTKQNVGVVFQSQDEDRAVHDVEYVKTLWANSHPKLKERWPLRQAFGKEAYNRFEMANGSWCLGVPGNPDKIRSEHPTYVFLDEAAHIEQYEASFNIAVRTNCLKIVSLSSAAPGAFEIECEKAKPVDWPYPLTEGLSLQ